MNANQITRDCLEFLNLYRKRHNLHELIYEEELEKSATEWGIVLRRIGKSTPSLYSNRQYGETIFLKKRAFNNLTGWEIATTWFAEGFNYLYGIEGETEVNRNFTQIVWAASREFGLGILFDNIGDVYIVGHFRPPGNISSLFKFNVFPECEYLHPIQPSLEEMNIIGLRTHNIYRKRHDCELMILCHDLIASAQKWAEHIAPLRGKIIYSKRCSYSESISVKFDPLGFICSRQATDDWYSHGKEYDYINYKSGCLTDLFTQMIWKSVTEVGFGRASSAGYHYLVAQYRLPTSVSSFVDNIRGLSKDFI